MRVSSRKVCKCNLHGLATPANLLISALAPHRMSNLGEVHKLLEGSYTSMPQPQDTEKCVAWFSSVPPSSSHSIYRPKYYVPRNPIQTPSYYPQSPIPNLNTPAVFSQLDVETLFYVFYFHPGTYQQYVISILSIPLLNIQTQ